MAGPFIRINMLMIGVWSQLVLPDELVRFSLSPRAHLVGAAVLVLSNPRLYEEAEDYYLVVLTEDRVVRIRPLTA